MYLYDLLVRLNHLHFSPYSLYQVFDPKFRQCRGPKVQYVVRRLVLVEVVVSDSHVRAMEVSRPSTRTSLL